MNTVTDELNNNAIKEQLIAQYNTGQSGYKVPTEIIDLPSKGLLYDSTDPLSSGKIEIKYMTTAEEDILTSKSLIQQGVVIDRLLQALIVTKINYNTLISGDKDAIMIAARIMAYGPEYPITVSCNNCNTDYEYVVDLNKLDHKEFDTTNIKPGQNSIEYTLPVANCPITIKALTNADEDSITKDLKMLEKVSKSTSVTPELSTRYKYIITSINGDSNKSTIVNFINSGQLSSKDSLSLRKFIQKTLPGVNMNVETTCSHCSHVADTKLPISANFFWPSA